MSVQCPLVGILLMAFLEATDQLFCLRRVLTAEDPAT